MLFFSRTSFALFFLSFCCASAGAQTKPAQSLTVQEKRLVQLYDRVLFFAQKNDDSTALYSQKFDVAMTRLVCNNPATLKYPFHALAEACTIETAGDSTFRIYSWDTWTGG